MSTAAIVGGSLAGAGLSAGASIFGANKQSQAAQQAAALQQQQYNQTRQDQAPYRAAGTSALGTITSDLQNQTGFATPFSFQADPGYQFNLQQGQNAINSSAAAKGGVLNGGTLKALDQYSTGLANSTYNDAYNRYLEGSNQQFGQLSSLAALGQGSTQATDNAGANSANNTGNYLTQGANATAAGAVGAGNAVNSGISNGINGVLDLSALQHLSSASSYGTPPPINASSNLYKDLY